MDSDPTGHEHHETALAPDGEVGHLRAVNEQLASGRAVTAWVRYVERFPSGRLVGMRLLWPTARPTRDEAGSRYLTPHLGPVGLLRVVTEETTAPLSVLVPPEPEQLVFRLARAHGRRRSLELDLWARVPESARAFVELDWPEEGIEGARIEI